MTEFEIAQIALKIFEFEARDDDNEYPIYSYSWCVEQVKKAHGIENKISEEEAYKRGYDKGFEEGKEMGRNEERTFGSKPKVEFDILAEYRESEYKKAYEKGFKEGELKGYLRCKTEQKNWLEYFKSNFDLSKKTKCKDGQEEYEKGFKEGEARILCKWNDKRKLEGLPPLKLEDL